MAVNKTAKQLLVKHEKDCADCQHTYLDHLWQNKTNAVYVYKCQTLDAKTGVLCQCQQYKPMTLLEALARVEELLNEQV